MTSSSVVSDLAAKLTEAPAGRRSLFGSLMRFGVTGVLSVAVDVGILTTLHSGFDVGLLWATLAAYAGGLAVNYTLNRNWTFKAQADHRETLIRYAVMISFNFCSTLAIVLGLSHLGLYYLLSKLIAIAFNAVINFLTGRYWVFRD